MATTPISEIIATIQAVKAVQRGLEQLVGVVENLTARVEQLEKDRDARTGKDPS